VCYFDQHKLRAFFVGLLVDVIILKSHSYARGYQLVMYIITDEESIPIYPHKNGIYKELNNNRASSKDDHVP
jgi:hypothetical protein